MAKLNGVTVLPAVAERIQYEEKTYVAALTKPKQGDIVRAEKGGYADIEPGELFVVYSDDRGIFLVDNEGDKRPFYGEGFDVDPRDFTVFRNAGN